VAKTDNVIILMMMMMMIIYVQQKIFYDYIYVCYLAVYVCLLQLLASKHTKT